MRKALQQKVMELFQQDVLMKLAAKRNGLLVEEDLSAFDLGG